MKEAIKKITKRRYLTKCFPLLNLRNKIMQKQKRISTLFGIIIIIIAVIIILGGVFVWQHFATQQKQKSAVVSSDPSCDGVKDPYYNLGFGVEHTYEGDIKPGMHVKIVLSCDHQKLTISGAVNQVIQSSDLAKYNDGENIDLADLSSGTEVIGLNYDYNFDGYKDLESIVSSGQGISAIDTDIIFLYNPKINKFVYQPDLSALENIYVYDSDKTIRQEFNLGYDSNTGGGAGFEEIIYKWNNNSLAKVSDEKCEIVGSKSSAGSLFYRDAITNGSGKVILDQTKKLGDGSCFDGQP